MNKNHIILITSITILGGFGLLLYFHLTSFKRNIVRIAKREAEQWKGLYELSADASSRLVDYWKSAGLNFSESQMQDAGIQSSYPWSSAFISYLFAKAGANDKFPYSSSHSGYFQYAKENRDKAGSPLKGFRISEYAPKVGDLVVYSRTQGKGYDSSGFFPSHGELVIETGKGFIKAVGGNVSNSVRISRYTTDEKGKITRKEKDFFMVIQNNIR